MNDLISRLAVRLIESDHDAYPQEWNDDYEKGFADCLEKVLALPSIDAVPVVRCKDCKHHEDEENGMVYCKREIGGWVDEDWFCADGERKES